MTTVLNESQVLAKTRCQDLYSVYKLNCWGSGIKDVSLVRKLVNVEVIGLSSNEITTLEDFSYCTKLKELILRNNKIGHISEVAHLQKLTKLTNLWLQDNPCAENTYNYRKVVLKALPNLTVLDNIPVTREELQEIEELGNEIYEEVPYESSNSSNSGPSSSSNNQSESNNLVMNSARILAQNQQQPTSNFSNGDNLQDPIQGQAPGLFSNNTHGHINQLQNQDDLNQSEYPNFNDQQQQPNDSIIRDASLNYASNDTRNSMSARLSQRPQSRTSMQAQLYNTRSLNSQDLNGSNLNCSQNQGWSMNNLSMSNNNNNILPKGGRAGTKSNIVSAILCLIKELDYPSCEVVRTALHIHMEETSQ